MLIEPYNIDGKEYYTVKQFAAIVHKSELTIRGLMSVGNTRRKLTRVLIGTSAMIPASELTDFPFTTCGRTPNVYHYDKSGGLVLPSEYPVEL